MPAGLVTRLIVKINRLIEKNCFWRSGVVVKDEGARAAIVEDVTTKQIRIDIEGDDRKKERLFRVFSGCPVDPCAIMQFLWDRYRPLRSSLAADRAPASHKSLITFMLA